MPTLSLHPGSTLEAPRFRRVLAASCLDEAGVRAGLRAARLPLAPGARVVLLHVVPPWASGERRAREAAARRLEEAVAAARDQAAASGSPAPEVLPVFAEGWPATEIVRAAWQERAELIVVGPPGVRGDGSARGTVSRVIQRADLPLLVARGDPGKEYRRVVCAVDRSVTATDTVALAARLTAETARAFTLFHAYHVPFDEWVGDDAADLQRDALEHLHAVARDAATQVNVSRVVLRRGDHRVHLLGTAAAERADLVALGTHGRSGLSRILLGSTAEWVIANSPFDVAIARPHRFSLEASRRSGGGG